MAIEFAGDKALRPASPSDAGYRTVQQLLGDIEGPQKKLYVAKNNEKAKMRRIRNGSQNAFDGRTMK